MLYIFLKKLRHPESILPLIRKDLLVTLVSPSFSVNLYILGCYIDYLVLIAPLKWSENELFRSRDKALA